MLVNLYLLAMKKVLLIIFAIFVLLVGIVIAIPIIYKDKLRAILEKELDKNLNADVDFKEIHAGIFKQFPNITLTLDSLIVTGKGEFNGDTLLATKQLDVELNLQKLILSRKVELKSLYFYEPDIHILIHKDGNANYNIAVTDTTTKSSDTTSSVSLNMDKVILENADIIYNDESMPCYVEMLGVYHEGGGDFSNAIFDWTTKTDMRAFTVDYDNVRYLDQKESSLDMVMEVNTNTYKFTFKENNIRINHFHFGIEGWYTMLPNGYDMDMKFAAKKTVFSSILSLLPGIYMGDMKKMKTDGDLAFDGFVKGLYSDSSMPAYHVNLKVNNAMFKFDSLPMPVENIQFHLVADNKDGKPESTILDFKTFAMKMDDNTVKGNLRIEGLKNYALQGDIKADIDLDDIDKFYPMDSLVTKGDLKVDVKVNGVYNKALKKFPALDAKFSFTDGYIKSKDYPEPMKDIHLIAEAKDSTGNLKDGKLSIIKLTYTLEDEPFAISGSIINFDDYNYDLKIKGAVDLAKLTKIYPVKGMTLAGIIDTDIETKGKVSDVEAKRFNKVTTSGSLEIKDLQASGAAIARPVKISEALFTFTPEKIILEKFSGKFGRSSVTLKGELTDYMAFATNNTNDLIKGDLDLQCDTLDINEWIPKPTKAPAKADTTNTLTVIAIPKNIDFVFDSDINFCLYDDMKMTELKGEIRINNGTLSLTETGFNALDAKFYMSGDYNTSDLKHPFMDFDINIKELDIQKAYKDLSIVRTLAPAAQNMHGIFSVDYTLKSDLDKHMQLVTPSMLGGGQIRIHEAKIDGMKLFDEIHKVSKKQELQNPSINDFVLDTEIKNNQIVVKPTSLKISGLNTDIQGTNNISGTMDYLIKIELLPIEKLKIPFHVTGSYDKPKIAMGKAKSDSTFAK